MIKISAGNVEEDEDDFSNFPRAAPKVRAKVKTLPTGPEILSISARRENVKRQKTFTVSLIC